ncbi:MAG: NUDIX hydrolase [Candidatus Latescibacteria bacterium]|nr:NUDIX hydrolase [Candidatus Latescibacterota bacterium]NIO54753.1 NUDIX hydrolase [Candidatus Latescibacterota bacterium]
MSDMKKKCSQPSMIFISLAVACFTSLLLASVDSRAITLPKGYWSESQSAEILEKTFVLTLNPDLTGLTPGELSAAEKLIEVGQIFHSIYENSRHHQAASSYEKLVTMHRDLGSPNATQNILDLHYLFKGPIARTMDNEYVPFLPVDEKVPGKNVYPWGVARDELDRYLTDNPKERSKILHVRTVVRRSERAVIDRDMAMLEKYPVLTVLHPELTNMLGRLKAHASEQAFYAIPYSVAYADQLFDAYRLLMEAAKDVETDDIEFARYLRHRARDLLANDYEAGDAAWVTGQFKRLNAQIGAYEVYDDELYSVKSFFGLVLMVKDEERSVALKSAIRGLQDFENSLPYEPRDEGGALTEHKRVREDIPVGVYNVVADFGQSRGTNTATILPNESYIARKYGRTILMRYNILTHPELIKIRGEALKAAVAPDYHGDFTAEGNFYRTLWHEIGHYLGPDLTHDGRQQEEAFEEISPILEELKSDLVSLFLVEALRERSYYSEKDLKGVYASGIRRVILKTRPKKSQPYQTMELMQFNYFLERGLLEFSTETDKLGIHYDRYHDVVATMLEEVLALQYKGDKAAAECYIERYSSWDENIHGRLAESMRRTERYRYAMVKYGILGE